MNFQNLKGGMKALMQKVSKLKEARKTKTIVFVLSTMRSGSTLLKSLLANAPDISHLPEVDFQKYTIENVWKLKTLSTCKIILLKKPAPFDRTDYPIVPRVKNAKQIILIRDVYANVKSIKKMIEKVYPEWNSSWDYDRLVNEYWYNTYSNILKLENKNQFIIKYEDLIRDPVELTAQLFRFLGSQQKEGVSSYNAPTEFEWKWGQDDGGEKLKFLKVVRSPAEKKDKELVDIINRSEKVNRLRKRMGYI